MPPAPMFTPTPADTNAGASDEQWLDRPALAALQRRKLASMLREVRATNSFYRRKYQSISADIDSTETLPFTTRAEIEQD